MRRGGPGGPGKRKRKEGGNAFQLLTLAVASAHTSVGGTHARSAGGLVSTR